MPGKMPVPEKLSRREREIMDVLYALGDRATAEEIRARLSEPPSYSAARAMLAKLETKGHLHHIEEGLRYVFIPVRSRKAVQRSALQKLVHVFFGGDSAEAALALIKQEDWTDQQLEALRQEIDQARTKKG